MTEISGIILALLQRAYDTVLMEFNENEVEGESSEYVFTLKWHFPMFK